jgi:UDP-glucose:(heptosyl)LPS alpha-1,3-glucosyltransferase
MSAQSGKATSETPTQEPAGEITIVAHDIGSVRGMERQLTELLVGLLQLGHRVTVIARTCELPVGAEVHFHRVRGPSRPFLIAYPWFIVAGTLAVRRWRRGVVHATGAIVLNKLDVISVHYCHQVGPATPSRATRLFRAHIRAIGILKRTGERVCFRVNRAAVVVCVSEGVADEVRQYFPAVADRVLTIHNGIDTKSFAPEAKLGAAQAMRARLGIASDRLVAVFVASEWERKGLAAVIRALALAPDWDLVVAGGGDEQHYQELAESLGVGQAVHWLGVTREVEVVYELADAFVMASSYETFSLVSFEAAASGLAILATPVNGVRELIEDGRNGFLITQEPRVIAERLTQLAQDPALRVRLGQAARRSALEYGAEKMIAKHHQLYAQLAAMPARRAA